MTKYFRVKYGYGVDDFYSIPESDLPKALRAQISGAVAVFDAGTIAGNSIIAIMPDLNRVMGYNRDYQLTGEDYDQIGKQVVEDHRFFLEKARMAIASNQSVVQPREISAGVRELAASKKVGVL